MKRALLALALLAPALAGCLSATTDEPVDPMALVSPILYDTLVAEAFPVAMDDGATIDAWVYRPDTSETGEKVPVIINFSPYWSNLAPPTAEQGDAFSQYLIDYYVPRGYAVALASARGTGLSEGCFTIGGPREVLDMGLVVDALATADWSNGNVTATGKSYDGTMAQGLLTLDNPHVKTIVPVSPISELYKYNYFGGVPYLVTGQAFNTYYTVAVSLAQNANPFDVEVSGDSSTYTRTPTRFCEESLWVQTNQYHSMLTGDYTAYWQARNYTALLPDQIDASVFYIHGLQDWNVKPDHMVPWIDELHARDVTIKAWLGQWAHDYPTRDDFNQTLLRWLDHYLKGKDTGILAEPLVQVQDNDGLWRHEDAWPVTDRSRALTLFPSGDGTLGAAPGTGTSQWLDAPMPLGGAQSFEVTLEQDLRLVGAPHLNALVSSTAPRGTLSLTLLLDGEVINQGFLDLAHRTTMESSEPMTPGAVYPVTVPMYPQDVPLNAGSTLRLVVSHQPPESAPVSVVPSFAGGQLTLHHGEGTLLSLPVIDADDITPEERQPEDVGCWAC